MKISVVMATYNGEKYLEQQILSILSQTLPPAELIVCDDHSTDGTMAILEKYSGHLTYVINDRQLGLIDNFKKAVSLANEANYISLSDQDDEWLPEKLENCAARLSQIEDPLLPGMVYSDLVYMDQEGKILNPSFRNEQGHDKFEHNLQTLLFGNFVSGCTMLMNPELGHLFAGIPNDVRLNHDGWIALIAFTFGNVAYISSPQVRYRKHESNVSIATDTKPRNRYRSTLKELINSFKGQSDFLSSQMETVRRFYDRYHMEMEPQKKLLFEQFLMLESKPYIFKKIAYRRVARRFRL